MTIIPLTPYEILSVALTILLIYVTWKSFNKSTKK